MCKKCNFPWKNTSLFMKGFAAILTIREKSLEINFQIYHDWRSRCVRKEETMKDVRIIELFWQRDETALTEVENKYANYCFAIAWKILMNREDSEECVNDTWLAAWNTIPPKRPSILPSFLGRITRNFAIDTLRKKYGWSPLLMGRQVAHILKVRSMDFGMTHVGKKVIWAGFF